MFGEVLCLPVLPINHTETDRDTESSHKRERQKTAIMGWNSQARSGCWEKKRKMGKMDLLCVQECWEIESRSIWLFHLCSERIIEHIIRRDLMDCHSPSQDPVESEKQDYEALNPGKKLA